MAKKNKPDGPKYSYMDTYGDLVTLLLCFFVLLFSMSTVDENKYNAFAEALARQFSPEILEKLNSMAPAPGGSDGEGELPTGSELPSDQNLPADMSQLFNAIEQYINNNGMQDEVSVQKSASGATFIRLADNLLFDGDSSVLKQNSKAFLGFLGECLMGVESQIWQVNFYGHTAALPGSATDDWLLSAERAGEVSSFFENTVGFKPYKIRSSFFGKNFPIADNATEEGRAKNRRVDIVVLSNDAETLQMTLLDAMRVYFPDDDLEFYEGSLNELLDANLADPNTDGETVSGLTEEQISQIIEQEEKKSASG